MPASTTTKPEPMPVIEAASVWLRSALVVRSANRRSSSARIRAARSSICFMVSRPMPSRTILAASFMRCDRAISMVVRNSSIRWS